MMMTGPLLAWIQELAVQHFTLEVSNLFIKLQHFRLLLVMITSTASPVLPVQDLLKIKDILVRRNGAPKTVPCRTTTDLDIN